MANFDSGVSRYIEAEATVRVAFPVDWNGKAEIACKHCPFFVRSTMRCGLNQAVVNFPEKYVGEACPLGEVEENV
jgi:hypothetical protein